IFVTGGSPDSVAVGDFNGDGLQDLVVANSDDDNVSVFLNTTAPGATTITFASPVTFAVGAEPFSVAVADMNGDGLLDLVVANTFDDSVSVLLGTTAPGAATLSFATQVRFSVSFPVYVAIADFNGDGVPDVVTSSDSDDNVSVLLNMTTPGGTPVLGDPNVFAVGAAPEQVAVGDINGDGRPDLVVPNRLNDNVTVLINTTLPGETVAKFTAQPTVPSGGSEPDFAVVTDFNGDGKQDIAVLNADDDDFNVLLNTTVEGVPLGFAAATNFPVNDSGESVATADFNGDGKQDMVSAGTAVISVLLNTTAPGATSPSFGSAVSVANGNFSGSLTVADFNGDGKPDVAAVENNGSGGVRILINTTPPGSAVPTFASTFIPDLNNSEFSITVGDFNGDGKPDLAMTASNAISVMSIWLNTTSPGCTTATFATPATFNLSPASALPS